MATVIALFDDVRIAASAASDLMKRGLHRDNVDMISHASNLSRRSTTAHAHNELVAETKTFSLPGTGEVFAEGPVAGMLDRAQRGSIGGGLIGVLVNLDLHEADAGPFAEGVRRGGTLLVVKCDDEIAENVRHLLQRHGSVDMTSRVARWRKSGWQEFDPQSSPYTSAELESEHTMNRPSLEQKPGPQFPQAGAGGGVWSGIAPHTQDDEQIRQHAEAERLESMNVSSAGPEFRAREAADPFKENFQAHFAATYAGMGSQFEEYEPAYRFGALLAQTDALRDQDWRAASDDVQAAWEKAHPRTWERYRDAIRFGWGIYRGRHYPGPERRQQGREENARYFW